jgi:hypothetical protein
VRRAAPALSWAAEPEIEKIGFDRGERVHFPLSIPHAGLILFRQNAIEQLEFVQEQPPQRRPHGEELHGGFLFGGGQIVDEIIISISRLVGQASGGVQPLAIAAV